MGFSVCDWRKLRCLSEGLSNLAAHTLHSAADKAASSYLHTRAWGVMYCAINAVFFHVGELIAVDTVRKCREREETGCLRLFSIFLWASLLGC